MPTLKKKPTVEFPKFTPAMIHIQAVCYAVAKILRRDVVVSSGNDSKHGKGSRHYSNEAIDVRSKRYINHLGETVIPVERDKVGFRGLLEEALGPQFRVLLENLGTPNEHYHVQVVKGQKYDPAKIITEVTE